MSPETIARDGKAREAVLDFYAKAHDRLAEQEQTLTHEGRLYEAEGAHITAAAVLRAWIAENDDPEPKVPHG